MLFIVLFQQLQLLVLTEVTVAAAVIRHTETRDMPLSHLDRQGEPGAFNRARRHQAYRQFVLWRHADSVCGRPKSRNHRNQWHGPVPPAYAPASKAV